MRRPTVILIILTLTCCLRGVPALGQGASLQPGVPLERNLTSGQSHSFSVKLEPDQFLQFVVYQHGIDVIVRVFSPAGKTLGEFDTLNGNEGPENVSLVSEVAGVYRIEVAPLGQFMDPPPGRYEIKVVELRQATEQELQSAKNQEVLKAHALALLSEVADSAGQLHVLQTRVKTQLQTAQLLWPTNEKLATRLVAEAVESIKESLAPVEPGTREYYQSYWVAMQLRQQVIEVLGPHDPEMALAFLRATHALLIPEGQGGRDNEESALELSLANQIIAKDPKIAVRIAQDTLKNGFSQTVIEIIVRLRAPAPEQASQLAKNVASKLMSEKLLENQEAANLAINLLRTAHSPVFRFGPFTGSPPPLKTDVPLLSEQEYKDLLEKALGEALSFTAPTAPSASEYSPERAAAQNILTTLQSSLSSEMTKYAPGSVGTLQKKITELTQPDDDPESQSWQKYQEKINEGSLDAAQEEINHAPQEIKERLSQLVVERAMSSGDIARAKQIVKANLSNPAQRREILAQLKLQEILQNAAQGKIEEALKEVGTLQTSRERAAILNQFVNLIGPGKSRAQTLELLEQARNLVGSTARVENQEQMNALLEIARAFSRYDSKRAFEIVEPLLDQFNDMSAAAMVLDGFGQQYYQDGELQLLENSGLGTVGNQLVDVLGSLARANFERAKAGADRIERPEVRIVAYLAIAQEVLAPGERQRPVRNQRINSLM